MRTSTSSTCWKVQSRPLLRHWQREASPFAHSEKDCLSTFELRSEPLPKTMPFSTRCGTLFIVGSRAFNSSRLLRDPDLCGERAGAADDRNFDAIETRCV